LISIIVLYFAFSFFVFSIPLSTRILEKVLFLVCLSPLFGNFGVNINHDTFFTSGIFLLVGLSLRLRSSKFTPHEYPVVFIAVICLLNSKTGYFVILAMIFYLLLKTRKIVVPTAFGALAILLFFLTNIGITRTQVPMELLPALADIKCVAQHPEANLGEADWEFLSSIAETSIWKKPKSCSSMDEALSDIRGKRLNSLTFSEFTPKYFEIAFKNPAIVVQAHLQRGSEALPPPFFQGPPNQVDRNLANPVGLNTNTALQLGPEVLHPSIDDPALKIRKGPLKLLEDFALLNSFLINQASWFWGWGGLWLWPIFYLFVCGLRIYRIRAILEISYPIVVNHVMLVMVGPIATPRYVMSSILIGFTCLLCSLGLWVEKIKKVEQ
jgi:hypothetical protein